MIRETLVSLGSDNGDANENVAEKQRPSSERDAQIYRLAVPVLKSTQKFVISCRKQEIKCFKFYHFAIGSVFNLLQ